jgi:hypothetical protein
VFVFPSAYAIVASISESVAGAVKVVVNETDTFAVPKPGTLGRLHVTVLPDGDAGQAGFGRADTAVAFAPRSTVIVGCVAVADPWLTNFTITRPVPPAVSWAGNTVTVKQFGVVLGGVPTNAHVFVLAALPIPAIPSTTATAIVPTRAKRPHATKSFCRMTPYLQRAAGASIVNTFRLWSQSARLT